MVDALLDSLGADVLDIQVLGLMVDALVISLGADVLVFRQSCLFM